MHLGKYLLATPIRNTRSVIVCLEADLDLDQLIGDAI
jgi:hypothetical protein